MRSYNWRKVRFKYNDGIMKKLILILVLLVAGMSEVQSQGITVRELSGGSESTYHLYPQRSSVFLYMPPYSATDNEYDIRLTFTPGGAADETGIVTYDGNDYVIDRSYGDYIHGTFQVANLGTGIVLNASRDVISGAVLDVPSEFIQFALAGWTIHSASNAATSPDGRFSATLLIPGRPNTYAVSIQGSGDANTNFRQIARQTAIIELWRNTPAVPGS